MFMKVIHIYIRTNNAYIYTKIYNTCAVWEAAVCNTKRKKSLCYYLPLIPSLPPSPHTPPPALARMRTMPDPEEEKNTTNTQVYCCIVCVYGLSCWLAVPCFIFIFLKLSHFLLWPPFFQSRRRLSKVEAITLLNAPFHQLSTLATRCVATRERLVLEFFVLVEEQSTKTVACPGFNMLCGLQSFASGFLIHHHLLI